MAALLELCRTVVQQEMSEVSKGVYGALWRLSDRKAQNIWYACLQLKQHEALARSKLMDVPILI